MASNDPRRQRGDLTPEPDSPMADLPPAHAPNGRGAFTIDAAKIIGKAVADAISAEIGQPLAEALARIAPPPRVCAPCLARRVTWERANKGAIEQALDSARAAAAATGQNPAQTDLTPFLPAGIPAVNHAITCEQGTDKCAEHIIGGVQAGSAPLLVATANVPPGALTQPARLLPG